MLPSTFEEAWRLSEALAKGGGDMIPKHFQGNVGAVFAAIQRGAELGFAPMASMQQIAVINGRPSIWGDALPALVLRAGHRLDEVVEGEGDKAVATATVTRGDTGHQITRTFSMADAKKAGLAGKQGPWQQYPKRMLQMRARGFAVRDGCADVLLGLSVVEEVRDAPQMRDVTPASAAQKMQAIASAGTADPAPADDQIDDHGAQNDATRETTDDHRQADPGETAKEPSEPTGDEIEAARSRGFESFDLGVPLAATPPEYADFPALTKAWKAGWNEGEKAAKAG
ncbi:hypothetical protein [Loktanella sp. 3ANDIMAR09]|uniref:hypothetical protein n=1 Tax=Loktanella sp. 3ANDIMAR09 TaxID=1225657 RepID=UPI00155F4875|nr:hypothetical protein [Loktanella sp. 3ANDIMAR09]